MAKLCQEGGLTPDAGQTTQDALAMLGGAMGLLSSFLSGALGNGLMNVLPRVESREQALAGEARRRAEGLQDEQRRRGAPRGPGRPTARTRKAARRCAVKTNSAVRP